MSTPLSTPVRQAKLGIASTKSLPLANEYKKLLNEQHQRLWVKHQQDLDLIDDIRSYVKARLSIERDYTSALSKLGKQHSSHIAKRFTLLDQCDPPQTNIGGSAQGLSGPLNTNNNSGALGQDGGASNTAGEQRLEKLQSEVSDSRMQKRLANNGLDEPEKACSLYKVWSEHIRRLQSTSKNRAEQFEQLLMVVDKLKDIRQHKSSIGKKCLDTHLRRIHEDLVVSMVDVEKARKLYYEDESQAKKARENEERIKKKRSGLLTKFTDLQAKKEKTSAQREANDIQSTQARNDYIMALAAGNAHLQHYYQRDLTDFIHLIDDGVLDHCKIFMATLSECDINSLKDTLANAQYWSKMINLTGSQKTNAIFLDCKQSACLRHEFNLAFEACNNDPIQTISLEHNADYALQHEIDKWFTWFKKECRNLSQLMHQLETCKRAFVEGKKSIELNGQTTEDLEPKIIELKQQIRKSEAAKLKAQARLKVIKEGGMQIEEWSAVESEIRADMARAQEEHEAKKAKEVLDDDLSEEETRTGDRQGKQTKAGYVFNEHTAEQVHLQVSKDSDDSEAGESINNLASVSRSSLNLMQKQQNAATGYSALTDPSLVWQDDYSNAWSNTQGAYNVVVTDSFKGNDTSNAPNSQPQEQEPNRYDLLGATNKPHGQQHSQQNASMTVQSSSPLSAIVDSAQTSQSPYQGVASEAYKSDYECDYNRSGQMMRSTASSAEPYNQFVPQSNLQTDPFGKALDETAELNSFEASGNFDPEASSDGDALGQMFSMLNKRVVGLYNFEQTNEDDLAFSEGDILVVLEVNDANWVRARSEATGEEGYVPASYIKLVEDNQDYFEQTSSANDFNREEDERNATSITSESAWNTQDIQQKDESLSKQDQVRCRALYDYEPEANTYEDDGLPHLALIQGELMLVINQGEDDGWWLVEKEDSGVRGHVPSMLVEEVDQDADEDEYEDDDEEDGSDYCADDGMTGSVKAMPTFEPPVLQTSIEGVESGACDKEISNEELDTNNNDENTQKPSNTTSLVPTSFIIIEPTPEVESKGVESGSKESGGETSGSEQRPVVQTSKPPSDVSYSVINEEFVLEGPARKPHHHTEQIQHHETPTILEESLANELSENQDVDLTSRVSEGNEEASSVVNSADLPAPPCVVIESCEDPRRDSQNSDDYNEDNNSGMNESDNDHSEPVYTPREKIKHTGNVDVNPILRLRAEEFSKQIIAEAIMLAPGANVGPSTSSAYI